MVGWEHNTYGSEGKEYGVKKYPERASKNVVFPNHLCGKKYFLPFEFSSDITTSIYGIYKLLDKHTNIPHFTRSLLCYCSNCHLNVTLE